MKKVIVASLIVTTLMVFGIGNLYAAEELALITWEGYAPQSLVDKFQKETGITVKVTYSGPAQPGPHRGRPGKV
jgi:spermidine/putrescine transport system substrate-binding protein